MLLLAAGRLCRNAAALEGFAYIFEQLIEHRLVFAEVCARGVIAAAELGLAYRVRATGRFLDETEFFTERERLALTGDSFSIEHVEFRLAERGCHLVFHDFDAVSAADRFFTLLYLCNAADIDTHGRVEFKCFATGRRFGIAKHDAYLHTDLIDENDDRFCLGDDGGQFAECLRHETGLLAHMTLTHVALDFVFRRERSDRVDYDDVYLAAAHQRLHNFERLLASVRLRDKQRRDVDADFFCILGVECVLSVDERADTATFLRLGDGVQGERGLTGRFRPKDLDD